MLEARELRIGNLVYCPEADSNDYVSLSHLDYISQGHEQLYEPIPLTEDWLVKFGFKKIREYFTIDDYQSFNIFKDDKGYYIHIDGGNLYLKSIHQLQNLYFALTGEELTIN